jgi:enoyl-CoA hydratase/carnithine racemase
MSAARTSYETLLVELDQGVALVTLNRPDKLNAIDRRMRGELFDALWAFEADDSVRAVVVTGAGRAFCAGAEKRTPDWPAIAEGLPW